MNQPVFPRLLVRSCSLRGYGIAEEDYVGVRVLAKHPQGFTVRREMKGGELFGWEVCDLAACGAVEWLEPEIVDCVVADVVEEGFPCRV